ncbi:hypothetical protein [Alsobacter sp. R-9]
MSIYALSEAVRPLSDDPGTQFARDLRIEMAVREVSDWHLNLQTEPKLVWLIAYHAAFNGEQAFFRRFVEEAIAAGIRDRGDVPFLMDFENNDISPCRTVCDFGNA